MSRGADNPLARLDRQELVWLFGILKDACRERLEKNLIGQALEQELHRRRGALPGRPDPLPELKEWEPRYRKFLAVAGEIHRRLQSARFEEMAGALSELLPKKRRR